MSSDIVLFGTVIGVLITLALSFIIVVSTETRYPVDRRWYFLLPVTLTAWLWMPWVAYGVVQAWRWSVNGVEYLERQPQVLPKDPEVIDLNKQNNDMRLEEQGR